MMQLNKFILKQHWKGQINIFLESDLKDRMRTLENNEGELNYRQF